MSTMPPVARPYSAGYAETAHINSQAWNGNYCIRPPAVTPGGTGTAMHGAKTYGARQSIDVMKTDVPLTEPSPSNVVVGIFTS